MPFNTGNTDSDPSSSCAGNYCESKRIPALGFIAPLWDVWLGTAVESPIHFSISSPLSKTEHQQSPYTAGIWGGPLHDF